MELRAEAEAAEARDRVAKKDGDEEEDDLGDIAEVVEAEPDAEADAPKKKKAKAKKTTVPKPRKKTVKVVRKRVVWVVFDNSSKKQGPAFDYPRKAEAEAYAEKLRTEKKGTYFVQPVKEEIVAAE
jgi:hypothetical protein